MIKSTLYYWVECDACGTSAQEGSDYAAWGDAGSAVDTATNADWITVEDGDRMVHLCDGHGLNPEVCSECEGDLDESNLTLTGTAVVQSCPSCKNASTITLKEATE